MTPLNRRTLHVGLLGVIACAAALCYYITRPYVGIPVGKPTWEWVFARIEREWPDVPQMTTSQLADRLATDDDPPELIDTRTWKEYAVSHLPGAIWAKTPAQIRAAISDVPPTRSVVLYCSVGIRSSKAAAVLMKDGRRNVFNLRGSIFEWANEGRALEHDGKPAAAVHPYNRKWGVLLDPELHSESPR
jgi:rhodanese-related sulfurtransferase